MHDCVRFKVAMSHLPPPVPIRRPARRLAPPYDPTIVLCAALRQAYDPVVVEPLPEAFKDLLTRID